MSKTISYNFTAIDKNTVKNLQKSNKSLLPKKKVNTEKDDKWNIKQINSQILQGITSGEDITKISKRLMNVTNSCRKAAVRNARTMTTSAQNRGRLDSYKEAQENGVQLQKVWMATEDDRTRIEHSELDGQSVPIDEKFEVDGYEIDYPGDPDAEPEMVYNCRCTMYTEVTGFNNETNDVIINENIKTQEEQPLQLSEGAEYLLKNCEVNKVEYKKVETLKNKLTDDEIIKKLAGGDKTSGSCASLALAYVGNVNGLDVTDYRGGQSLKTFSTRLNLLTWFRDSDIELITGTAKTELTAGNKLLKLVEEGEKYYFVGGRHAAIVTRKEGQLYYLELQSGDNDGWTKFNGNPRYTLHTRFGFRTSNRSYGYDENAYMVNVKNFGNKSELQEMLGYINTATDKQKKGSGGYAK